jgi:glycosyltransferase involved in cell wall biosynthesis
LRAVQNLLKTDSLPSGFRIVLVGTDGGTSKLWRINDLPAGLRLGRYVEQLGLGDIVQLVPKVPYLESLEWMRRADVLISIDAPSKTPSPFVPSKLVNYLAASKPVLNLTSPGSASGEFTDEVGGMVAPPDDPDRIAEAIVTMLRDQPNGFAAFRPSPESIAKYSIKAVTGPLEQLLQSVAERRTPVASAADNRH